MSFVADLTNPVECFGTGMDSIIIRKYVDGIKNGKTLDTTGFPNESIEAGHVVVFNPDTEVYKPMPLNEDGTAYGSLPEGYKYAGVTVATVKTIRPFVGIMFSGAVNDKAVSLSYDSIKAAMKAELPTLVFEHD